MSLDGDAWGCLEDAWTLEAPISWQLTHVVNLRQLWALAREHIIFEPIHPLEANCVVCAYGVQVVSQNL